MTPSHLSPIKAMISSTESIVFFWVHIWNLGKKKRTKFDQSLREEFNKETERGEKKWKRVTTSTRQSCSIKRLIQRVPGIGLVLTTLYFPFGFHTSIETGFAIEAKLAVSSSKCQKQSVCFEKQSLFCYVLCYKI